MKRLLALAFAAALALPAAAQQQIADPDFRPAVADPAWKSSHPVVLIDEAHDNFHTLDGRYAPFAQLLRADGYDVRASRAKLNAEALKGARVLVIANAGGGHDDADLAATFTDAEAAALRGWVEGGGSLLLIADHAPFGAAAERLGRAFGVRMGKGYVFEPNGQGLTTQIDYSGSRLGEHPITRGLAKIRAFTGQSLTVPAGAVNLMKLSDQAREAVDTDALNAIAQGKGEAPKAGPSQGLAMTVGKGRVVVLGEAGMLSAQMVNFPDGRPQVRMGMNVAGYDNRQFALNLLRWLSGAP